ncbi:MAG TPA: arsenite methyltransferase [Ignavibacteriaceae bacterium]|nr:arsenite methyltransferase [Ignavibacteriaceae bacterium]
MSDDKQLKEIVKNKYAEIAISADKASGCCGTTAPKGKSSCCSSSDVSYSIMNDEYKNLDGYVADADLQLGCGIPTEFAGIKKGDTVVDLGSGAGNDVFVARSLVGEEGKVIGIDFTPEMIEKANKNNRKIGYNNVEFILGEIEEMPLPNNTANVIISNCVLNLVPNKVKAFSEMYKTLKPGGHFCVSDIVVIGNLPEKIRDSAALYAGCVSGAVTKDEYISLIEKTGFKNIEVKKAKDIFIPDEYYLQSLAKEELVQFKLSGSGLKSITVVAYK